MRHALCLPSWRIIAAHPLCPMTAVVHDMKVQIEWDAMLQLLVDSAQGLTYLHLHKPAVFHEVSPLCPPSC